MFKIHDERSAVRRIQSYLHYIKDRSCPSLPYLSIDGIYGDEMRIAVKAFQKMQGLDATGIVDNITNDKIYAVYKNGISDAVESPFDEREFPVSIGAFGAVASAINHMLFKLRSIYEDIPRADNGNYFGRSSENVLPIVTP